MAEIGEIRHQREQMATRIMRMVQDELVIRMPFFNRAIFRMPLQFYSKDDEGFDITSGMGTDGRVIFCNAEEIIDLYRKDRAILPRTYIHMVFHCLFCHPFQYDKMSFQLWDFVTDLAVENTVFELNWKEMRLPGDQSRQAFLRGMRAKVSPFTAENLYHYYFKHREEAPEDLKAADLFALDKHAFWVSYYSLIGKQRFTQTEDFDYGSDKVNDEWKRMGKTIQLELEAFRRYQDKMPGSAIDNITAVYKEKYDYRKFLKKFLSRKEEMKVNQDEFDYIFYTYGMKLYGNMPLIEPLEYQEMNKIHDFVIAIDTSGSCQGKIVRSFLNKTYTILKDTENFFENMNLHIIQCDCEIHSDVKITNQTEFDRYIHELKVEGFGGTDFRPVFERVNEHVKNKEFQDLKGLLYFSDGLGTFPGSVPEYPTAFIILEDEKEKPKIPSWVISLVMHEEELDNQ